jgi:hypothetical protein
VSASSSARSSEPELIQAVRRAVRADGPLELLALASTVLAVHDPRSVSPMERGVAAVPPLRAFVDSLIEMDFATTTALLTALAPMIPDEVLVATIRRALGQRRHPLPHWLAGLAPLRPVGTYVMTHVLGDGDNLLVGVVTAAGDPLTAVVYVDHNLGTLVKDAFVIDETLQDTVARYQARVDDPDLAITPIDPADARERIVEAIATAAMTFPPFETETWPGSRALIEWMIGGLPEGGTGYQRVVWEDDARAKLQAAFLASPYGAALDGEDAELLESILWYATDYGPGDPLKWSPVAVEILLLDWIPRKIVAPAAFLARAPAVLRAFVRYAHDRSGIRPELTGETLDAIAQWEDEYQQTIRTPRPQGPMALLAAAGWIDEQDAIRDSGLDAGWLDEDEPVSYREMMLNLLREEVGDDDTLWTLNSAPLPSDEPLDLTGVADDIRERVREVAELLDAGCLALFDAEHRTAGRRLLADVARGDPRIFRRKSRVDTAAAALAWVIGKANSSFQSSAGGLTATALCDWFGVPNGSYSQRAATMLKAIRPDDPYRYTGMMALGSPRYLTGTRRAAIIETRDRYNAYDD